MTQPTKKRWPRKHGHSFNGDRSPEYRSWAGMWSRCTNPKQKSFRDYGARGIAVCERWRSFPNFLADMGPKPSQKHTLERVRNHQGYHPKNCRWATRGEQMRNTTRNRWITLDGKKRCLAEWAELTGISESCIRWRFTRGWSVRETLTKKVRRATP